MTKPQQPELRRSGLGKTDQDSEKLVNDENLKGERPSAPVPEENQPGHRPRRDQDKPEPPA